MKNDTIVSVIICYDFYHNDFDMLIVIWWKCSCMMIYANFNIIQLLHLLNVRDQYINMRFYGAEYNNIERSEVISNSTRSTSINCILIDWLINLL
jgi:hypothetical protein